MSKGFDMYKKLVLNADQKTLNFLGKQDNKNDGFDVNPVTKLSYGKILKIKGIAKNIGSNYGLKKVIVFVNFANYLDTVILNLRELKSTGLVRPLKNSGIIKKLNTLFTMEHISIKLAV